MNLSRVILLSVLLITPWRFGGVSESTQMWVFAALAIAALTSLIPGFIDRNAVRPLPFAMAPLVLALGLVTLQLVPLPHALLSFLSPATVAMRSEFSPTDFEPPESIGFNDLLGRSCISLNPAETRYELTMLLLVVTGFFLGAQCFSRGRSIQWLLILLAVNGALLSFVGMAKMLTGDSLAWIGADPGFGRPQGFATFVNRNNAGGFLNLCVAATIGVLNLKFGRRRPAKSERGATPKAAAIAILARILVVWTAASILCTLSRGAALALLCGTLFTFIGLRLWGPRRPPSRWSYLVVGFVVLLVGWVGMHEAFVERMATLQNEQQLLSSGRWPNWKDASQSVWRFPVFGSGLGTYRHIYTQFQQRFDSSWYFYAENQYLQALVESGIVGLSLMLLQIVIVILACRRLLRRSDDPRSLALATTGLFAIASLSVASFFDFGLYLPSNGLMLAVIAGAVTARASSLVPENKKRPRHSSATWPDTIHESLTSTLNVQPARMALAVAFAMGCLFGAIESDRIARANAAITDFQSLKRFPGSERILNQAIERLSNAARLIPDHAETHYQLAKAWTQLYRRKRLDALRVNAPSSISLSALLEQTSPSRLHERAYRVVGDTNGASQILLETQVSECLFPAVRHLLVARACNPLLAKAQLRLAQLSFLVDEPEDAWEYVDRVRRLVPSDEYSTTECGLLFAQIGQQEKAIRVWKHCLSLNQQNVEVVIDYARRYIDWSKIVSEIFPADPALLVSYLQTTRGSLDEDAIRALTERGRSLLATCDLKNAAKEYLRAKFLEYEGLVSEAVLALESALQADPSQTNWRFELAGHLSSLKRFDEAVEQVNRCANEDRENFKKYQSRLDQIRRLQLSN